MRYLPLLLLSFLLLGCQPIIAEAVAVATPTPTHAYPQLANNTSMQQELLSDQAQVYDYFAETDETITFLVEPATADLDIAFEIYTVDYELLADVDEVAENGEESISYHFTKAGRYLVSVHEFNGRSGHFTISTQSSVAE